jgi:anti-sigma B factor antagonist
MPVHIEREGNLVRVTPEGEMTIYQAEMLKSELLLPLNREKEIEINLSQVTEMDTAGFQLLILLKREAQRLGKTLRMVAHSPATLEVIDAYRMASYFGDPVIMVN